MKKAPPPIYVVSGGKALAGDHMVRSLLVQYPDNNVPVIIIPHVTSKEQIDDLLTKACTTKGIIAHTMVSKELRDYLTDKAPGCKVKAIDFMGELADHLNGILDISPLEQPGLYRDTRQEYYNRVDAIEFTLSRDDGMNPKKLSEAEIVLTGVSRVGKTPLSIYLAMFGWKVANVPLIRGIDPPGELFEIDRNRVFGLTIGNHQLLAHRKKRMANLGINQDDQYIGERMINDDLQYAEKIFKKGRFTIINVTNKPIESSASEIIQALSSRYDVPPDKIRNCF
ncbi:MAG: pyruvate, water dikinase regulatory protein [Bacteroidales bacterium]|jgi:hypothetical protein